MSEHVLQQLQLRFYLQVTCYILHSNKQNIQYPANMNVFRAYISSVNITPLEPGNQNLQKILIPTIYNNFHILSDHISGVFKKIDKRPR